jgi:hypothetical protein
LHRQHPLYDIRQHRHVRKEVERLEDHRCPLAYLANLAPDFAGRLLTGVGDLYAADLNTSTVWQLQEVQ